MQFSVRVALIGSPLQKVKVRGNCYGKRKFSDFKPGGAAYEAGKAFMLGSFGV